MNIYVCKISLLLYCSATRVVTNTGHWTLDTDEAYVSTCVPMLMINLLGQHITR